MTSTLMGPHPKAMVNGQMVGEGEVVAEFPRNGNPRHSQVGCTSAKGIRARDPDEIATMPGCSHFRF